MQEAICPRRQCIIASLLIGTAIGHGQDTTEAGHLSQKYHAVRHVACEEQGFFCLMRAHCLTGGTWQSGQHGDGGSGRGDCPLHQASPRRHPYLNFMLLYSIVPVKCRSMIHQSIQDPFSDVGSEFSLHSVFPDTPAVRSNLGCWKKILLISLETNQKVVC